jgi:uncharacterized protein (UPF0297 family)
MNLYLVEEHFFKMATFRGMIQHLRNMRNEYGERIYENNILNQISEMLNERGLNEMNPLIEFVLGPDPINPIDNYNDHWEQIGISGNIGHEIYWYFRNNW